jgi:triacylglycerol esterase/lipase EstA (alpha/beta hydrolase family)
LTVAVDGRTQVVPIRFYGFAWQAADFSRLTPTDKFSYRDIHQHYTTAGLGLPLVGERVTVGPEETFFRDWMPFAVTAVLRPADAWTGGCGQVLEFYNPLLVDRVTWCGATYPLARDLTAPLAATLRDVPRQYFRGFTAPTDTSVKPKLTFLEPYQRGKIPVVFIHGLYSDPLTWVDMLNDLRAQPDLYARFQFWLFRYPTGGELLESAAVLRQRLCQARNTFDPMHTDPALDNMVLVGHSLGGLVSKLQITRSYDLLWREMADQPFDALHASPPLEERMARDFFFEPVPLVKRVVFIGTPHHGSSLARRLAGCVGNALVTFGTTEKDEYLELVAANPGVFKPGVENRQPTTVSLLDPDSPFLVALSAMPINCATRVHSIIGTGGHCGPPGDGVVPVTSACHPSQSELFVPTTHEKLHHDPASTAEVARILRLHAAEVGGPIGCAPGP